MTNGAGTGEAIADPRAPGLMHPKYRRDIDGLRCVAVVAVVLYHAFPSFRGGFVGVDIFFVISGYLISGIIFSNLEHGSFSILEFYRRRIRRIFPALLLVLVACFAGGWFLLLADEYQSLSKHVAAGAAFVSNLALWNESGYFDAAARAKPLLHLWSLGIEEQFYLVWPLLLWLSYRRQRGFLWLTLLIAVVSFAWNIHTVVRDPVAAFYSPLTRFWELMLGGILAYLALHRPALLERFPGAQSVAGLLLIAVAFVRLRDDSLFPGWWALLPSIGAFLVISAGPATWINRRLLGSRPMVGIGLVSYPLYLWHWPVLFLCALATSSSHGWRTGAVLLSLALAVLTYYGVEKPLRRLRTGNPVPAALLGAMAVCGLVGVVGYVNGGYPARLPAQFTQFAPAGAPATACFLQDRADFGPSCTAVVRRPAVLVWGDSHANALAAGFELLQREERISLLEVTGPSCPPLLHVKSNGNTACVQINDYALQTVRAIHPDLVVLNANWASDAVDRSKLDGTVQALKDAGITQVVVMGPAPRWNGGILRAIFRCWHPKSPSDPFPAYSTCGLDPSVPGVEQSLRETSSRLGVRYVSVYQALCNVRGCLTHLDDGGDHLATYDYAHLSDAAARYVVNAVSDQLLPRCPDPVSGRVGSDPRVKPVPGGPCRGPAGRAGPPRAIAATL